VDKSLSSGILMDSMEFSIKALIAIKICSIYKSKIPEIFELTVDNDEHGELAIAKSMMFCHNDAEHVPN
jgi:hypothetical protein